jgi:hypothetical protein
LATDIDLDGCGDLMWRDSVTGSVVQRLMTSTGAIKQSDAIGGNSQWSLVNTYTVDWLGVAAVIWRDGSSGVNVLKVFFQGSYPSDAVLPLGGSQQWTLLARPGRS